MQITAKVLERFPERSGTSAKGNAWVSQSYMVEYDYDQQYPKQLAIEFYGEERVKEAQQLLRRDTIATFDFDPTSRKVTKADNSTMVFTSCSCYRITIPNTQPQQAPQPQYAPQPAPAQSQDDELPF